MASPSPAKQLAILRRTAEVLAVLHSAGWVFGDLNPRNILAWPDAEEVVLVDLDTLAENRVAFGKSSSAHIKRARVLGLVPPWGLPGSAAQIDDTFVLVGFVGQAGGTRPELEVISPNTAVVVDEVARLINRPSTDTPSMGTLWAAMCMDEDRRRRCPLCGCLHCHSDSCPNCQYSSPATLIQFTSKSDNRVTTSTLHADPRNRARIRRRHIFAGPRATRDDCRYLVEINSGSVSVLSAVDDHQLPIGVPVELADELGAATVCIEVQDGC